MQTARDLLRTPPELVTRDFAVLPPEHHVVAGSQEFGRPGPGTKPRRSASISSLVFISAEPPGNNAAQASSATRTPKAAWVSIAVRDRSARTL